MARNFMLMLSLFSLDSLAGDQFLVKQYSFNNFQRRNCPCFERSEKGPQEEEKKKRQEKEKKEEEK